MGGEFSQHCATLQGKTLFFHFTCPSDKYFADFGCPNIKSTRAKKIKRYQNRIRDCDLYYILCKLSTPDLTKLKKKILLKINVTRPVGRVLYEFQSSKAKTYLSQTSGRVNVFCLAPPPPPAPLKFGSVDF